VFCRVAPANGHDAPFATPLLATAVALYALRPRVVRLDAAYWGLALIAWIHTTLGAVTVIPFNPKAQYGLVKPWKRRPASCGGQDRCPVYV